MASPPQRLVLDSAANGAAETCPDTGGESVIRRLIALAAVACLFAALLWAAHLYASRHFLAETAERGRTVLALQAENLRGWLDRFRALPRIYAESTALRALLAAPGDPQALDRVNHRLALWNGASGAADTYLLDADGLTLAASNWADPITFVGKNYAYRPYYRQAMQGRLGRFFALGTASGKRGYYFSYPVVEAGRIRGAVVVKAGVEAVEAELAASPFRLFVTGPEGVVLLAGEADWRLRTAAPLSSAARAEIGRNRQFDLAALAPLAFDAASSVPEEGRRVTAAAADGTATDYLLIARALPTEGWTLNLLVPTASAESQALTAVLLVGLILAVAALLAALLWQRRRRLIERLRAREETQALLERTVDLRTVDLRQANLLLEEEVRERKAAEEDLRRAQSELVQAGKLAALGQMSAALSHEFNQPLSAIRAYADNALAFIERGREDRARDNLGQVVKLTERMAELSRHLRSFARRPQASVRPVSLAAVLQEAVGLLAGQIEAAGVRLEQRLPPGPLWVRGGHVRLQQVTVNLIANALDALAGRPDPWLGIAVRREGERLVLLVEDNGPGLAEADLERVFDPFFTTKEVGKGLGLGLSISYNIVKDFGGNLEAANRPGGGAAFRVTLTTATPVEAAAE